MPLFFGRHYGVPYGRRFRFLLFPCYNAGKSWVECSSFWAMSASKTRARWLFSGSSRPSLAMSLARSTACSNSGAAAMSANASGVAVSMVAWVSPVPGSISSIPVQSFCFVRFQVFFCCFLFFLVWFAVRPSAAAECREDSLLFPPGVGALFLLLAFLAIKLDCEQSDRADTPSFYLESFRTRNAACGAGAHCYVFDLIFFLHAVSLCFAPAPLPAAGMKINPSAWVVKSQNKLFSHLRITNARMRLN